MVKLREEAASSRGVRLAMLALKGEMGYASALTAKRWGFYDTLFRGQIERLGAAFLSGYDLYFHQGVQAFEVFTGRKPDSAWVRSILARPAA